MGRIDDNNKFRQNWEEMIAAVIELAAKDYVSYYKRLKRAEAKRDEISFTNQSVADFSNKLRLIEKFFRSGWFETISEINGNEFIAKLKEKVQKYFRLLGLWQKYARKDNGRNIEALKGRNNCRRPVASKGRLLSCTADLSTSRKGCKSEMEDGQGD